MGNNDIECCVIAFCEQWGNTLQAAQVHYWPWGQGACCGSVIFLGSILLQSLFQTYYHTLPSTRLRENQIKFSLVNDVLLFS